MNQWHWLVAGMLGMGLPAVAGPSPETYMEEIRRDLAEVEAVLTGLERFVREQDARLVAAEPVSAPDRAALELVQMKLGRAARVAWRGDVRVPELQARLEGAKRADARLRAALAPETRMRPDAYAGGDAEELKAIAGRAVSAAHPDVVLLQTALVSPGWTEEEVLGWTDESQTGMETSEFRWLLAEVAGRINANTMLYTVEIRQRRLPGGWEAPAGSIWHAIPMLEENARQEGKASLRRFREIPSFCSGGGFG